MLLVGFGSEGTGRDGGPTGDFVKLERVRDEEADELEADRDNGRDG